MYSYLAIVQAMHPQMNVPTSPQQKRLEEEARRKRQEQEYLAQQHMDEQDADNSLEQYNFDYHRVSLSLFSFCLGLQTSNLLIIFRLLFNTPNLDLKVKWIMSMKPRYTKMSTETITRRRTMATTTKMAMAIASRITTSIKVVTQNIVVMVEIICGKIHQTDSLAPFTYSTSSGIFFLKTLYNLR
jgi:hypothetical protein